MRSGTKIIAALLAVIILISGGFPVSAAGKKTVNRKAHKAYEKVLPQLKKKYYGSAWSSGLPYAYRDVDGDKIDELIIQPGWGYCNQEIYDYQNGKVKAVCAVDHGSFTKYYPKKKVIYIKSTGTDYTSRTVYYVQKKGVYKIAACRVHHYETPLSAETVEYYKGDETSGKKISKAKYQKYVKKLIKGAKAKKFSKIKWKKK